MTPASQSAISKDVTLASEAPRLRRWPLLWTVSFAIGASLLLWGVIFLAIDWAAKSLAA